MGIFRERRREEGKGQAEGRLLEREGGELIHCAPARCPVQRVLFLVVGLALGLAASAPAIRGEASGRRVINLPGRSAEAPFSDSVLAGDTLYLAGKLGLDPKTGKPPADPEQEIRLMLDRVKDNLAAAGMTMDDLVKVEIHCSDISLYDRFNAIYKTYFTTSDLPARAFLGSGPLLRGARFEITAIAVKR